MVPKFIESYQHFLDCVIDMIETNKTRNLPLLVLVHVGDIQDPENIIPIFNSPFTKIDFH